MNAGTFPGPTPYAGLPELYAARTSPVPPVARITPTSCWRMSSRAALDRGVLHTVDQALGSAHGERGAIEQRRRLANALMAARVGAQHDGILRP